MERESQSTAPFDMTVPVGEGTGQNIWEKMLLEDQLDTADETVICSLAEMRLP